MPTISEQLRAAGVLKDDAKPAAPKDERGVLERFLTPLLPSTTLSDYWNGPKEMVTNPGRSFGLLGEAIANDPAGAIPVVGNVKHGISDLSSGNVAGAAGNGVAALLSLFGIKKAVAPELSIAPALEATARTAGKASSAVGQGAEMVASGVNHPLIVGKIPYAAAKGTSLVADKLGSALQGMAETSLEKRSPRTVSRPGLRAPSKEVPGSSYPEGPKIERFAPNTSDTPLGEYSPSSPLTWADDPPTGGDAKSPRLNGKAPDLNSELESALQSIMGDDSPVTSRSSKLADTPDTWRDELGKNPRVPETVSDTRMKFGGTNREAELANIGHNAPFGEGAVVPSSMLPTELRAAELEGLNTPPTGVYDSDYGGIMPEFTHEAMSADVPSMTVGNAGSNPLSRLETAVQGIGAAEDTIPETNGMALPYADWSQQLDEIINAAAASDMPIQNRTGFLSRSKPTQADIAGMNRLRAGAR